MNKHHGKYRVCVIVTEGNKHASCFLECAVLLKASLSSLGTDCDIKVNEFADDRINVILGYHLLKFTGDLAKYRYIPYQLEQLCEHEGVYSENVRRILSHAAAVWDYSRENIDFLRARGISAHHLPVGYHPALEHIPQDVPKDIDVLFYGSIGPRRREVLDRLAARNGLRLKTLFGVYGKERDAFVARSKIVLNIHYYAVKIFEMVRISYLLNNKCFVLPEVSDPFPYPGVDMACAAYDDLAEQCYYYLGHEKERECLRLETYEQFKRLYPMTALVEKVLDRKQEESE